MKFRFALTDLIQIIYAYEDERGEDVVAAIDFWPAGRQPETIAPPGPDPHMYPSARH